MKMNLLKGLGKKIAATLIAVFLCSGAQASVTFLGVEQGNAGSLGHLWEHVAAQAFDDVSSQLGYGEHEFVWYTERKKRKSTRTKTVYDIHCFHTVEPPAEFNGLESLTTGYLNALIEGLPFPVIERIKSFVNHRTIH